MGLGERTGLGRQVNALLAWFARSRARAVAAKLLFALVLISLVAFEGVALARQPTYPHAIVAFSGVFVCLCAVPWSGIPLLYRAWPAVAVSGAVTLFLFTGDHPLKVWGLAEAIALLILLSGVLQRAPTRVAAVLGPLLGLAAMAAPVRDENPGRFTTLFAVLTVVVAAYSLLLRAQSVQRTRDLQAVRSAERIELARELHDLVAHHVTGIVVQAGAARFTAVSADQAAETFARIEKAGEEALGAMRRLVKVLREGAAETAPAAGLAELREMTARFSATGPPAILYVEPALDERLPADLAAVAHHIVRECLTNIRKHAANATAVRIGLRTVPAGLEIRVADDGTKPAPLNDQARGGGFGLAGLTERVTALGGELTAGPSTEGGWEVRAVLPI
ncbi:two-component sensor histidine kinase [Streptomyces sp. TRM66268-LWL]|uniref:histidine kinase n=1 Tax=Streptomyces polyasparticus TaxID=2767826 RepID=A0ABR7SBU4_9ACTN|nr:histidine kinase [Streptomyces polyasparticus]MBC9712092.1 two-component sensor histidine kinase [Streptomyces polyasparticus]